MPTFAEVGVGLPGDMCLLFADRLYRDPGASDESVELAAPFVFGLHIDHHTGFHEGRGRNPTRFGSGDRSRVELRVVLLK